MRDYRLVAQALALGALVTVLLVRLWLVLTPGLNTYPIPSSDEGWILSVSYKLAHTGTFGSDLYRGFANADTAYFISLPIHHFLQAAALITFGDSIQSARLVAVLAALVVLVSILFLAYRWFGLLPALAAGLFLVYWQPLQNATTSGLVFVEASRLARYDLTALALMLLAVVCFEVWYMSRRWAFALLCGILTALAALTQFFAVFIMPALAVGFLALRRKDGALLALGGFLLPLTAYGIYALSHWDAFVIQTTALKAARIGFANPAFYLTNLQTERARYDLAWQDGALVVGIFAALAVALVTRARNNLPLFVLGAWLACTLAGLALLDSTKTPLYALALLPPVSLCAAQLVSMLWNIPRPAAWLMRPATLALLAVVAWNMAAAAETRYAAFAARAVQPDPTPAVIEKIRAYVPPSAAIVTTDRLWWYLRPQPTRSWQALLLQATPAGWSAVATAAAEYYVLDDEAFVELAATPQPQQAAVDAWRRICTDEVAGFASGFGYIHIWRIKCESSPTATR